MDDREALVEVGARAIDPSDIEANDTRAISRAVLESVGFHEMREALDELHEAAVEYLHYLDGGESRGSYDGKPERRALRRATARSYGALSKASGQSLGLGGNINETE